MPTQEVVLKKIPAQTVASVRAIVPSYSEAGNLLGEVFAYLGQHKVSPAGPPIGIYYDEEYREQDVEAEMAVPMTGSVPPGDRVKSRELSTVDEMACIIHEGAFDTLAGTYGQLMGWVEASGYRIAGPIREVYVQWAGPDGDPSANLTEIQLPVEKS